MPFRVDMTGVKESGGFSPAPKGTYVLVVKEVTEGMSQSKHNQVKVVLEIAEGEHKGKKVWHNITFIPAGQPGAGFAKAWLKHIGQSHEGKVLVAPSNWIGRKLEADLDVEGYLDKEGKPKNKNIITDHRSLTQSNDSPSEEKLDEVPF